MLATMQESCGALDFIGSFGIDLNDDVHPWLFARSEQLCSPVCTSAWNRLMETSHRAQCWKFDNLLVRHISPPGGGGGGGAKRR